MAKTEEKKIIRKRDTTRLKYISIIYKPRKIIKKKKRRILYFNLSNQI